ncbi:hypothetical protein SAMN02745221_00290 [Thermosyntropha lipolytica DSM 11003]|uniref:Uncharacterized protein n=1 Tax=Thermosyntropha lipolytica DSM 11003 TaxID=1123382 RepID=A0A1M5K5N6_9FIRM|nr:hypothetical protein SAMN02745221_00290 [Thermosyntropha lipolytica DSM 11003]
MTGSAAKVMAGEFTWELQAEKGVGLAGKPPLSEKSELCLGMEKGRLTRVVPRKNFRPLGKKVFLFFMSILRNNQLRFLKDAFFYDKEAKEDDK